MILSVNEDLLLLVQIKKSFFGVTVQHHYWNRCFFRCSNYGDVLCKSTLSHEEMRRNILYLNVKTVLYTKIKIFWIFFFFFDFLIGIFYFIFISVVNVVLLEIIQIGFCISCANQKFVNFICKWNFCIELSSILEMIWPSFQFISNLV